MIGPTTTVVVRIFVGLLFAGKHDPIRFAFLLSVLPVIVETIVAKERKPSRL
jgi:hypothetical protein